MMEAKPTPAQIRQARHSAANFVKIIAKEAAKRNTSRPSPAVTAVIDAVADITRIHGLEEALSALLGAYMTITATISVNLAVEMNDPVEALESAAGQLRENLTALRQGCALPSDTVTFWAGTHGQGGTA
jgi:hypothetical protein